MENDNTVSATEPRRWRSGRKKGLLNPAGASVLDLGGTGLEKPPPREAAGLEGHSFQLWRMLASMAS